MTSRSLYLDVAQTVDFNTEVGKVGIVGIKTPSLGLVASIANGALDNFRKIVFDSCDVVLACVSQLPVDPLGVGFEPGKVAPQDVVNPILFKAVTGDSINSIINTIYGSDSNITTSAGFNYTKVAESTNAYYRMMNDPSFRVAHPQNGMVIKGLRPMVREVLTNRPMVDALTGQNVVSWDSVTPGSYRFGAVASDLDDSTDVPSGLTLRYGLEFMSGKLIPLPPQLTHLAPDPGSSEYYTPRAGVLTTYVGAFVLPPAIQQSLYFRMNIVWHIRLLEFVPSYEFTNNQISDSNGGSYFDEYTRPVDSVTANVMGSMEEHGNMVDMIGADSLDVVSTTAV